MPHKITDLIVQIGENLERLAKLKEAESKKYAVKIVCSNEPKYIDNIQQANPEGETGAMVTKQGNLIYYIKL